LLASESGDKLAGDGVVAAAAAAFATLAKGSALLVWSGLIILREKWSVPQQGSVVDNGNTMTDSGL
jgi:hypothetical protein